MENLCIRNRPSADDEFYLVLQYDSRNYSFPFPFDGYQLFLNNDQNPFVTLTIDQKKVWVEKIDFKKHLGPGTYTLRLRTLIWTSMTSAVFVLKVGDFFDGRQYPGPTPPTSPPIPFPEWEEYESFLQKNGNKGPIQEFWDQWTVDYGV